MASCLITLFHIAIVYFQSKKCTFVRQMNGFISSIHFLAVCPLLFTIWSYWSRNFYLCFYLIVAHLISKRGKQTFVFTVTFAVLRVWVILQIVMCARVVFIHVIVLIRSTLLVRNVSIISLFWLCHIFVFRLRLISLKTVDCNGSISRLLLYVGLYTGIYDRK